MNYSYKDFIPGCPGGPILNYKLFHQDRPLHLGPEMTEAIGYLLWYVPNVNSLRSRTNLHTEEEVFDDHVFEQMLNLMDVSPRGVYTSSHISEGMVAYYRGKVSPSCQKMLLTQGDKKAKTAPILWHIRNAIAHGIFNVVEDILVYFDFSIMSAASGNNSCIAIIKIRPAGLLRALEQMEKEHAHAQIAAIGFKKAGYKVAFHGKSSFDFTAEGGHQVYSIESKTLPDGVTLTENARKRIIRRLQGAPNKALLTDKNNPSKEDRTILREENIKIMSPQVIEQLFTGQDILV